MPKCAFPYCRTYPEVGYHGRWLCDKHLARPTAELHEKIVKRKVPGCCCDYCRGKEKPAS